jgi:uncharacterized membrane protein
MAKYCTNCGAAMDDTVRFCTNCGATIAPPQPPQAAPPPPPPQYQAPLPQPPQAQYQQPQYQQQYQQPPPGYQQPPYQAAPVGAGMQPNVAGLLCYILGLVTGIIFLVIEPHNKNRFVRFHAFQSIFFHVSWIVLWIVYSVLAISLPWSIHFLASLLYLVVALGGFLVWLFLMYKAYNNEMFKLPVIGDIAMKQAG